MKRAASAFLLLLTLFSVPFSAFAESGMDKVADASQMTRVEEVVEEGMSPVYAESLRCFLCVILALFADFRNLVNHYLPPYSLIRYIL